MSRPWLIIDLLKSKKKQKPLPEGGVWRTVRGAKVYIHNGKVIAGAEGKLSNFDMQEMTAIHEARMNKKTYEGIIFEGTEVRVGKERKKGKVVKVTPRMYHIDYGDGNIRKEFKSNVKRADAYQLKLEEKRSQGGDAEFIKIDGTPDKKAEKKQAKIKEEMGATVNPEVDVIMREQAFTSIKAPLLKRDEDGNPVKEPVLDEEGKQVIDTYTGIPKTRYVTYEAENATEEDLITDHQGLLYSEIVNPYAKRYGLDFIQREWRDADGNPTDLYGDLVQTANIGFLYGLREYAYKVGQGEQPEVDILTHSLMRSRLHVSRHAQDLFGDIKIPHRMLAPLSLLSATAERMEKELERFPTAEELANEVKGNPTFNSVKVMTPPAYDPDTGEPIPRKEITNPVEKVEALMRAKKLQSAISIEGTHVAGDNDRGDKDLTLQDTLQSNEGEDSMQAMLNRYAEQEMHEERKEMRKELRRVLRSVLDKREYKLITTRFGVGAQGRKKLMELSEVAERMGISESLAKKLSARAMKKLRGLTPEQLEDLKNLYLKKSLNGVDTLLKAMYLHELREVLAPYGLAIPDLESVVVRKAYGTPEEIRKSLDITEFVGSVVSVPSSDEVMAMIVEYVLPENIDLVEKAIGARRSTPEHRTQAVKNMVTSSGNKYKKMAKEQRSAIEKRSRGKDMGGMSWSVRLQYENPGSCWITWNGEKILINADNGEIVFDRKNPAHRSKTKVEEQENERDFKGFKWDYDHGKVALGVEMDQKRQKFSGNYKLNKKGEIIINSRSNRPQYAGDGWVDEWIKDNRVAFEKTPKNKILKQFPSGDFLLENPETGKRIVMRVEVQDGGTNKARTTVTYAFDPDADKRVNIGNWQEIARELDIPVEKGQNAYEVLRNNANTKDFHMLDVLTEDEYNELYGKTTAGARELFKHQKIEQVGAGTYQSDLGNGRVATFQVDKNGRFIDPIMRSLIRPDRPIRDANDLYTSLKTAIGNEAWVTLNAPVTHHLSHHVKVKYDGQGAPIVVGGAFDGYRLQDAYEVDDPAEKERSMFKGGKPIRTARRQTEAKSKVPFEVGNEARVRDPRDRRRWITAKIVARRVGNAWTVEMPDGTLETLKAKEMRHVLTKLNIASDVPILDVSTTNGMLNLAVPQDMKADFEANYGVGLDDEGRADISPAQFMEIRDKIGSFSLTAQVKPIIEDLYAQQQRAGLPDITKLQAKFDPNVVSGYKEDSFLRKTNFYNTQVEGIEHLVNTKRGIAGHGMGTGKTLIGVGTAMYVRDQQIKEGKKPGKTLIVSPAGIQSEWLKEINRHTDVGAIVLGGKSDQGKMMGQPGLQSKVVDADTWRGGGSEHFAVISYDQFMKNPEKYTKYFDNLIIDEVHAFKTKGGRRNVALKDISTRFENVWGLSGTPMDNQVTDIYHLVDSITGGRHDLGSQAEFDQKYLYKQGSKIIGMNEDMLGELGEKLAKYVQFRNGYADAVNYVDAETGELQTVKFPEVRGNPNRYHGQVDYVVGFDRQVAEGGREVSVPQPQTKTEREFYEAYQQIEAQSLSVAQRQALQDAERSGTETSQNYLQGVQTLQQFCNAPLSQKAYFETRKVGVGKKAVTIKDHKYTVDEDGYRRYWESDGEGGYKKDKKGNPVLLPPMHHNNPKAQHLKKMILDHLQEHNLEMERRTKHNKALKSGQEPLPLYAPKIVVTSKYDDFGAEVVANVFRDLERDLGMGYGRFTGDSSNDREGDKNRFQTDDKMNFIVISDAGKEGIDLGNAHMLIHYDQDFNPNKMAQKSARELRVDGFKHAEREKRPNEVKLKSVVLPGTIEDSLIQIQNKKMENIEIVERSARKAEGSTDGEVYTEASVRSQNWVERKKVKKSVPLVVVLGRRD